MTTGTIGCTTRKELNILLETVFQNLTRLGRDSNEVFTIAIHSSNEKLPTNANGFKKLQDEATAHRRVDHMLGRELNC